MTRILVWFCLALLVLWGSADAALSPDAQEAREKHDVLNHAGVDPSRIEGITRFIEQGGGAVYYRVDQGNCFTLYLIDYQPSDTVGPAAFKVLSAGHWCSR